MATKTSILKVIFFAAFLCAAKDITFNILPARKIVFAQPQGVQCGKKIN